MLSVMPTSVSKCRRTFRKLLISVFASFFLNANIVCADTRTFNYEVRWQFVTVGTIELNLRRSPEKNSISLSAKTKGPFKFLRAKEADVISTTYRTGERTYEFKSVDPKVNEERFIRYRDGETPVVVSFRELDTEKPLATSVERDGSSVDPFYVLARLLDRTESGQECDGKYQVYDGKRRYKVTAVSEFIHTPDSTQVSRSEKVCRVVLDGSSVESAVKREIGSSFGHLRSMFSVWLFVRKNQVLEIKFETDDRSNAYPSSFRLKTPVGSIVAKLQAQEEV
ncbi:uncharacterized protein METZ01_LOCUS224282 [marine metagenome]|uniref:DUF3108 domain-containing protein n=1 Tax=marine metagenome TaxID=408172 RepID=A0A382G873_9ZZZZ